MSRRGLGLLVTALLLGAGTPPARAQRAGGPSVLGVALPHRRGDDAPAELARAAAETLARRLGGAPAAPGTSFDLGTRITVAGRFADAGRIDEAAMMLDELLADAARAPHLVRDPAGLVSAHVVRASIALARGEAGLAAGLLELVLRWDPSFALESAEESPRMRAALSAVQRDLGPSPAVRASDLGSACREADVLVVARSLPADRVELTRFDACRPVASTVVRGALPPDLSRRLATLSEVDLPPVEPPRARPRPTPLPPVLPPPLPRPAPPLYRRPVVWAVAAAVLVGAGVGVWGLERAATDTIDVVPHY